MDVPDGFLEHLYTSWWTYYELWKIIIFNGKIHYKSPLSIAMLNYQRVMAMVVDPHGILHWSDWLWNFMANISIWFHQEKNRLGQFVDSKGDIIWLVVLTILKLKTIGQWEKLSHIILWKIKHVPNHQPAIDYWGWYIPNTAVIMPSYPLMVVQLGSQHFFAGNIWWTSPDFLRYEKHPWDSHGHL